MYWYLGIATDADVNRGNYKPSYVLHCVDRKSPNRSPYVVLHDEQKALMAHKVLVTQLTGNDHLIDFMSHYRTRGHMHGDRRYRKKQTRKYYPKGLLMWFECDVYGRRTGPAVFIKRVPDRKGDADNGFQRLKAWLERIPPMTELIAREPELYEIPIVKPKLCQSISHKPRKKEYHGSRKSAGDVQPLRHTMRHQRQ